SGHEPMPTMARRRPRAGDLATDRPTGVSVLMDSHQAAPMSRVPAFALLLTGLSLFWLAPSCAAASPRAAVADQAVDSPARQALDAWLAAFNTGERAPLEAYRARWDAGMDVERMLEFHAETGGFRLVRHEASEPGTARALLQEQESDTVARMEMTVVPGKP